ncbi:MAG: GntR family transcriptional regulator [Caldilineaceae bacterium]
MDLFRLERVEQRTLSDEAAERLRDAIRTGALRPGTRLVERDVAARLGMSRIPVREAIQRLVEEGLVDKSPHRGTFVYAPSRAEIEEISSLRVVLERFVVERAMERWTTEAEEVLKAIVGHMRLAAKNEDIQQLQECDYHFHNTLWEIASHSMLLEVVSGLRSRINRFLHEATSLLPPTEVDTHIESHVHLIYTLRQGNVLLAQAEMTRHVLAATARILTYCDFSDGGNLSISKQKE